MDLSSRLARIPHLVTRVVAGLGALVILAYYANLWFAWRPDAWQTSAVDNGIAVLLLVYAAYVVATGEVAIWNTVNGFDGRPSTSKFQPFLWTIVVVFAYVAVTTVRWEGDPVAALPEIPGNVLIVLGLAFGTGVAAKVITVNNVSSGKEVKTAKRATDVGPAALFQTDDGYPDLYKIQTLAFTFIAVGVFLAAVLRQAQSGVAEATLPDIPDGLMALMGIGSAAYLAKKLSGTTATYLSSIAPEHVSVAASDAKRSVTLTGANLGQSQGGSLISIGGVTLQNPVTSWSDTTVSFVVPVTRPGGAAWTLGEPLELRIVTGGSPSVNALSLTIDA